MGSTILDLKEERNEGSVIF